jgi:CubicO group peptidase (beta-lactamase class C family)
VKPANAPGFQYCAVTANGILTESFGGWADRARGRPMDAATTLMAYSMSKTITAAAVLTLVESGKIALDDSIDRYVDGNPYGPGVTVRHLLSHTSGIPNPLPLRWVHSVDRHDQFDESAALLAVLRAHPRPRSLPGVKYAYANIGYWLLGPIVERASGVPFTAYVREHVLEPLGIAPPELGYAIVDRERHAGGYIRKWSLFNIAKGFLIDRELVGPTTGRWVAILPHYVNGPAFGGLVGTARAFGRFLSDQLRPRSTMFGERARARFYEPQRTANGRTIAMTLGWNIGSLGTARCFYKEGGGGGFHSMMRVYPDNGIGTVVIGNGAGFDAAEHLNAWDARLVV